MDHTEWPCWTDLLRAKYLLEQILFKNKSHELTQSIAGLLPQLSAQGDVPTARHNKNIYSQLKLFYPQSIKNKHGQP